ncbi:MAG: YhgE/Pip domain-containing protein [Clostridia bacterium]|nr:YhgE/Pip domain-containing protein [Clostridia bacterium]
MGKIFRIFRNDLKTIYMNIIAFIVIIGITILPALYSWFNIASNWDPYSATGGIPFAVCNLDKGFSYKSIEVNAGQQIVDNLKENPKMGWDFVSEQEAIDGVESGKYYAAVVIPEELSENLCSLTTGEFTQSSLRYYVNEKKNAIAPKITNAGISTIENEMKSAYVNTVTNVLATMLNITVGELGSEKNQILENLKGSLDDVLTDINAFDSGVDMFISTLKLLKNMLKTSKELLPGISDVIKDMSNITPDIKNSIESTRALSKKVTDAIGNIIESLQLMQSDVREKVDSALAKVNTDANAAAGELEKVAGILQKSIIISDNLIRMLDNVDDYLGIQPGLVRDILKKSNDHQKQLMEKLLSAGDTLRKDGALPAEIVKELRELSSTIGTEFAQILVSFSGVKENINKTVDDLYKALEKVSNLMKTVSGDIPDLGTALEGTMDTVDQIIVTFEDIKNTMSSTKTKIEALSKKVIEIEKDTDITDLLMKIVKDPGELSEFFSQPVKTETHSIGHVENYGSGMSPFYTSLGIWVGGVVLIAIVRVELTEKQRKKLGNPGETQQYFGRYIIFFVLGQIQALIVSLGDIFFLKIQCNDEFLFVLGCMISAFVYTLIIYSLTITFNVIGKALAVIILVLQVAGSGGTFPIEVLPEPFQVMAQFLPFRYGNDILREAIAGPDMNVYWHNVLMLLVYVPFALVLGLLLRRPCIKLMHFLDKRIHQSELII